MLDSYRHHFEATVVPSSPRARVYELWFIERWALRILKPVVQNGLRSRLPLPQQQAFAGVYIGAGIPKLHTELQVRDQSGVYFYPPTDWLCLVCSSQIFNAITGFAYLVDGQGRIRWQV